MFALLSRILLALRSPFEVRAAREAEIRTHLSLDKDALCSRHSQTVGAIAAMPILGGLHHQDSLV